MKKLLRWFSGLLSKKESDLELVENYIRNDLKINENNLDVTISTPSKNILEHYELLTLLNVSNLYDPINVNMFARELRQVTVFDWINDKGYPIDGYNIVLKNILFTLKDLIEKRDNLRGTKLNLVQSLNLDIIETYISYTMDICAKIHTINDLQSSKIKE